MEILICLVVVLFLIGGLAFLTRIKSPSGSREVTEVTEAKNQTKTKLLSEMASRDSTHVLHEAIFAGNLKKIRKIVKVNNTDIPNLTSGILTTGLFLATQIKHNKKLKNGIIKVLLSHPNIVLSNFKCVPDSTIYKNQAFTDTEEFNEINNYTGLLHKWINDGEHDLVKALVNHPQTSVGEASMGLSVAMRSEHLCKPSNEKLQNEIIKTLLEHHNIDVNVKTSGYSPLHVAVMFEQVKNVETLLKHPKIDVNEFANLPTEYHKKLPGRKISPLLISIMWNKTTAVTKMLLEHPEIVVNNTDTDVCLPINVPVYNERTLTCFEMLLNHNNIDVNIKDGFYHEFPLISKALRNEFEIDIDPEDQQFYEEKALKMLLNTKKTNLLIKDDLTGSNFLHHMIDSMVFAYDYGQLDDETISEHKERFGSYYEIISEVLENNPDLITPDNDGNTPIDLAKKLPDTFNFMNEIIEKHFEKTAENNAAKNISKSDKVEESKHYLNKCCWSCDAKGVKLYKCDGCKKAYYCGRICITNDWPVHGGYCLKKQKKKKNE